MSRIPKWVHVAVVVLIGTLLVAGLAIGSATPASAADIGACDADISDESCNASVQRQMASFYSSELRPMIRWGGSSTLLIENLDGISMDRLLDSMNRTFLQMPGLQVGSTLNNWTSASVQTTVALDFVSTFGQVLDQMLRGVVRLFVEASSGITLLLVLVVVGALVAAMVIAYVRRGGFAALLRRLLGTALIFGILVFAAIQQAAASPGNHQYTPGTPMWLVKVLNDTVTGVIDTPARAISSQLNELALAQGAESTAGNPLSCGWFMEAMSQQYARQMSNISSPRITAAEAVDAYWMTSGLQVWKQTQLGAKNPWADQTYCYLLDALPTTAVSSRSTAYLVSRGVEISGVSNADTIKMDVLAAASRAPFSPSGITGIVKSQIAFAACVPTGAASLTTAAGWSLDPRWQGFIGEGTAGAGVQMTSDYMPQKCADWWNAPTSAEVPNEFNFVGSPGKFDQALKEVKGAGGDPDLLRNFLSGLTGSGAGSGAVATASYVVGSFAQLVSFLILCIVVWFAKLSLMFFAVSIWIVLLMALFKRDIGDLLTKTAKRLLSALIIAGLLSLIISIVALLARLIAGAAGTLFGMGTPFQMVFAGLAPAIAMWGLHLVFTKLLHVPSPMTLRGGAAWLRAGSSGMVAGGIMSAVTSSPLRRMVRRKAEERDNRKNLEGWGRTRNWRMERRGRADPTTGEYKPTTMEQVKSTVVPLVVGAAAGAVTRSPQAGAAAASIAGNVAASKQEETVRQAQQKAARGGRAKVTASFPGRTSTPSSPGVSIGTNPSTHATTAPTAPAVGAGSVGTDAVGVAPVSESAATAAIGGVPAPAEAIHPQPLPLPISSAGAAARLLAGGERRGSPAKQMAAVVGAAHTRGQAALGRHLSAAKATGTRAATGASRSSGAAYDPKTAAAVRSAAVEAASQVRSAVTEVASAAQSAAQDQLRRSRAAQARLSLVAQLRGQTGANTPTGGSGRR